jgi:VanZ family protein
MGLTAVRTRSDAAGSPLGLALISYLLGVTLLITLAPFRFRIPGHFLVMLQANAFDMAANVFLFAPLGFLHSLTRRREASIAPTVAMGFVLSAAIESIQLFSRGRYASPFDVVMNTMGAALGALAHRAVDHRLHPRLAGQLALELPLMNVVYLLVPLVWLDVLAAGRSTSRLVLAALLGVLGSTVLTAVWRHRLRASEILSPAGLGLAAGTWFLVAGLPGLGQRPGLLLLGASTVGAVAWLQARGVSGFDPPDRRFEVPALRGAAPFFAAYLLLLALWPPTREVASFRIGFGLLDLPDDPSVVQVVRLLELVAAFTLLGYLVAEYRSRRDEGPAPASLVAGVIAVLSAALLEAARGFHPAHTASLARALLLTLAGAGGALIYTVQRETFRRWRSRRTAAG